MWRSTWRHRCKLGVEIDIERTSDRSPIMGGGRPGACPECKTIPRLANYSRMPDPPSSSPKVRRLAGGFNGQQLDLI